MGNTKKPRKTKNRLADQKNKIRGVIARGKSQAYTPKPNNKASQFQKNLTDVLVKARERVGHSSAKSFIEWVEQQASAQVPVLKSAPVDSDLSAVTSDRKAKSLSEEIIWSAKLLSQHIQTINSFRQCASQLERLVILCKWDEARALVEEIATRFGKSIWLLETQIAIEQAHKGLDSQKQLVAAVRKQNPRSLSAYIGRFISVRNEPTTTLNSFLAEVVDRTSRIRGLGALKAYLKFKLLWNSKSTQRELGSVLVVAQGLSTVDLYETFIDVLQHAFTWNRTQDLVTSLEPVLFELAEIDDFRLTKLSILLGSGSAGALLRRPYVASDSILRGASKAGLVLAARELKANPLAFKTALIAASALPNARPSSSTCKSLWVGVIRRVAIVVTFGDEFSSQWMDLEKHLRNWSASPTLKACFYFLKSEISDDPEARLASRVYAALNNPYLDIDELDLYSADVARHTLSFEDRHGAQPLLTQVHNSVLQSHPMPTEIGAEFAAFVETRAAAALSLVDDLERLDQQAEQLGSRSLRVITRRAHLFSLVDARKVAAILPLASNAYFTLHIPALLLPLGKELASLRWKHLKHLSMDISLPIVLHICWRATGSDNAAFNLRSAYNDFLLTNNIQGFNELGALQDRWPKDPLIYFLRYVCIPEVLDMSNQVNSSREASEARREVCALLTQLDPENKVVYEDETFQITRALSVQDGMRVLDSSRVHVDTGALTSWAIREWEPNGVRYRALVEAGVGLSESLDDLLKELSTKQGASKKFLEIPDSDADLILVDLINGLRTKFLSDPNHGLDSYLSRRVRHHSMSGYLRGAVENEKLITTKDHQTGKYLENTHWASKISGLTISENQQLQGAFARFDDEFDKIIQGLKSEILRIKSEEFPKGVFSIAVSPAMFHVVRSTVQDAFSIEALCNVCYPVFWSSLKPGLEEAQQTLKVTTLNSISSAFHRLKAALRKIFNNNLQRYTELSVAIQHASEDLNRKVLGIADWFNRSESSQSFRTYALEQAYEICVEAALLSYRPFSPVISPQIEPDKKISAIMLVQLSDLILTMLGNVRQHADCGKAPKVEVILRTKGTAGLLLRMESDIGPSAWSTEARQRVDRIRRQISDGSYVEKVRIEGNSGLMKIASVALRVPDGKIDFDFVEDRRFYVQVEFDLPSYIEIPVAASELTPT